MSTGEPGSSPTSEADDISALEALIIGNPELDELELLLAEFNIFEAVGVVRQELRHSDFLSFLLDPRQNHGLGDAFVTRFLQAALRSSRSENVPVSPLDLDVRSLDEITVLREWQHIDILLLDSEHHLVVVIENKVGSEEHSNQLARYHEAVRRTYPGWIFFGIYLTPDGEPPSHPDYLACSYNTVGSAIEGLLKSRRSTMGEDVRTLLRHYHQMLHRHIMSESKIADLCRRIYHRHQRALDLIFEHRPDVQTEISGILRELVSSTPGLYLVQSSKAMLRFTAQEWETIPILREGTTAIGRILFFEFYSGPTELKLTLYIGPGPQDTRQRILEMARAGTALKPNNDRGDQWKTLRNWRLLRPSDYSSASPADLVDMVRARWSRFVQEDLPPILQELSARHLGQIHPADMTGFGTVRPE